jgi:pimeloyl-ACP methyl ester carboxylesterase
VVKLSYRFRKRESDKSEVCGERLMKKKIIKITKRIAIAVFVLLIAFFLVRAIGRGIYNQTPEGGINESMYVDINGTKQWINIYGEDVDNPVLLYLHGGPGSATSHIDYVITRKWADVYTVVTWDQRNCGKSYDAEQNDIVLTRELFMTDGKELTEFLLDYLSKEKITLLGHSWGSFYGANLVLEYPEYYECFIGTGQVVDMVKNEEALKQEATLWADGDEESLKLVNQLTPNLMTMEHIIARNTIMQKYGYDMMVNGSDYNLVTTLIFNPNYSMIDWFNYLKSNMDVYLDFFASEEFASFSLLGRTDYEVPFYNINGDKDYQTNYKLAQEYFEEVNAPYKQLFMMENMTHGLLESDAEGFSEIVHQIAKTERER